MILLTRLEILKMSKKNKLNFSWLYSLKSELEYLIEEVITAESDKNAFVSIKQERRGKKITLRNLKGFLKDILTGKINNRIEAAKKYSEKIMEDHEFLGKYDPRGGSIGKKIKIFMKNAKAMVFGAFLSF